MDIRLLAMDQQTYFEVVNYILVFNTLPVLVVGVLCMWWTQIARTAFKKTIFAAFGGALFVFVILRLLVALILPSNMELLVLVGVLHGIGMTINAGVLLIATVIVHRRTHEMEIADQIREAANNTPAVKRLASVEDDLISFGRKQGWC